MSRHRNVRNMIAEDYYDDYDDEDYYDDYDDYDDTPAMATKPKKKKTPQQTTTKTPPKRKNVVASTAGPNKTTATTANTPTTTTSGLSVVVAGTKSPTPSTTNVHKSRSNSPVPPSSSSSQPVQPLPIPSILLPSNNNNNNNNNNNTDKNSKEKTPLTVVVLGHVDAGKSTVTGHLLYATSSSSIKRPRNTNPNKAFNFAWLLDEDDKERQHGVTMDIATKTLETNKFTIVLQDAPGHADYVPNMITGTSNADACLLLIDATDFSTAFGKGAQLKEHVFLARGLGVQQVLVVINKMDLLQWNQDVYHEIQNTMTDFLVTTIGYAASKVRFIPVSGLTGVNIATQSSSDDNNDDASLLLEWYKGPTLLQALDDFDIPNHQLPARKLAVLEKPLRMVVVDVNEEGGGKNGVAVRAKVVQGWVSNNQTNLLLLPIGDDIALQKLSRLQQSTASAVPDTDNERDQYAISGEMIDFQVTNLDITRIMTGNVICRKGDRPPAMANHCVAKIWVLESLTIPIIRGAQAIFHMHHLDIPCHLSKLVRTLKKDGNTTLKERPRALTCSTQAVVELTLSSPIVMEAFQDCRALGRFVLRRGGDSIAVGRIEEVLAS